jgi:hypothetical protein
MERFLRFLAQEPGTICNFISYHRKGSWRLDNDSPWLGGLIDAAEAAAAAVLRLAPQRAHGLELINDEADMKVGFDRPFEPRMTERFAAWLAATLIAHEELNEKYVQQGLRFIAASDNVNQHLIRSRFDGRRSIMTTASDAPDDLLKLPVYAFYELLPFLTGRRHAVMSDATGRPALTPVVHRLTAIDRDQISVLFTSYLDRSTPRDVGGHKAVINYLIKDVPWDRINVVEFRIDGAHANPYAVANAAAGGGFGPQSSDLIRRLRAAQELAVTAPIQSGVVITNRAFRTRTDLDPFATVLLWITPFRVGIPAAPAWIKAEPHDGNVIVSWAPSSMTDFYRYEVLCFGRDGGNLCPSPLRSALWVDTAPPVGEHLYGVRTVTASEMASEVLWAAPVRI